MASFTHFMLASSWSSDGAVRISQFVDDYGFIIRPLLVVVVLATVPMSWKMASQRFEKRHQRVLWVVIAIMILLIPILYYWQSH